MSTTPVIHNKLIFQPQDECRSRDHFSKLLAAFIRQQCATWTQLREARAWLAKNLVKSFMLSDAEVFVQHNPHRTPELIL